MSTTTASLLDALHEANSQCRADPNVAQSSLAEAREQAADYFLESLLTSADATATLERECLARAKLGQKTYRLTTWTGSGPDYCGQKLPDLLDLGNLLEKMQDWLDENYRTDAHRFRVFNCRVRNAPRNTFNLILSWNEDKFSTADQIIETNRQMAIERRDSYERRRHERNHDDDVDGAPHEDAEETEDRPPRRQYDDRQRGGPRQRYNDGGEDRPRQRYNDGGENRPPRRRFPEGGDERPPRRAEGGDERPRRTEGSDNRRRAAPSYGN